MSRLELSQPVRSALTTVVTESLKAFQKMLKHVSECDKDTSDEWSRTFNCSTCSNLFMNWRDAVWKEATG